VIEGILFDWNVLTTTLVVWMACVSLALAVDFGPDMYREKKARETLAESVIRMAEQRRNAEPITFDPDATIQLGVFKIQPETIKHGRHAKV
jgi:hypothetical protein